MLPVTKGQPVLVLKMQINCETASILHQTTQQQEERNEAVWWSL